LRFRIVLYIAKLRLKLTDLAILPTFLLDILLEPAIPSILLVISIEICSISGFRKHLSKLLSDTRRLLAKMLYKLSTVV
jgi:hypothetical protein